MFFRIFWMTRRIDAIQVLFDFLNISIGVVWRLCIISFALQLIVNNLRVPVDILWRFSHCRWNGVTINVWFVGCRHWRHIEHDSIAKWLNGPEIVGQLISMIIVYRSKDVNLKANRFAELLIQ